jgi:phosphatidylinositol phospholipase C beta
MPMTLATLFVHLVLKTYVPDELSGLVDALADPRAYLSAQEKRKEALHNMGIDDSDIVEVQPTAASVPNSNGRTKPELSRKPDLKKINGMIQNSPSTEERIYAPSPSTTESTKQVKQVTEPSAENKYKVGLNALLNTRFIETQKST